MLFVLRLRACLRGGSGSSSIVYTRTSTGFSTFAPARRPLLSPVLSLVDARFFTSSGNKFGGGDGVNSKINVITRGGILVGGGADDREYATDILLRDEESLPAPPSYVRDAVTGKWTDRTSAALTPEEMRLLKLAEGEEGEEVLARLGERWRQAAEGMGSNTVDDDGVDGLGTPNDEHARVARRVREQRLALGTIGRAPAGGGVRVKVTKGDDGEDDADVGVESPLSPREYQALKTYAQKERNIHPRDFARLNGDDPDLIPHNTVASGGEGSADPTGFFDPDLDLAYLDPRMNRKAHGKDVDGFDSGSHSEYDPFADLLPSDLNPARMVNRRHAKPIPKSLLHQNNLALLRRYTTPGGKIMNRVQSRLGAKDQRKISKLVKRARHLGLIPHLGQWKFEDHGHLHERGLANADSVKSGVETDGKRDWEVELEKRGLWPLQDETELVKRYYDVEGMMEHIAGPKGSKKREELNRLLHGPGSLVAEKEGAVFHGGEEQGGNL